MADNKAKGFSKEQQSSQKGLNARIQENRRKGK